MMSLLVGGSTKSGLKSSLFVLVVQVACSTHEPTEKADCTQLAKRIEVRKRVRKERDKRNQRYKYMDKML